MTTRIEFSSYFMIAITLWLDVHTSHKVFVCICMSVWGRAEIYIRTEIILKYFVSLYIATLYMHRFS